MLYLLYLLTLGLINAGLVYLVNMVVFRVKGQTLVSHINPKSPAYDRLKRKASKGVVLINTLLLLGLGYILFLEVRSLQDMNESSVASPLLFGVVVVVAVDIVGIWIISHLNKSSGRATGARHDDNKWLT